MSVSPAGLQSPLDRRKGAAPSIAPPLNGAASEINEAEMIERMAFSVEEVCAMLGVSHVTVYARIKDGSLRSTAFGRRRLILRKDVEALFNRTMGPNMGGPHAGAKSLTISTRR